VLAPVPGRDRKLDRYWQLTAQALPVQLTGGAGGAPKLGTKVDTKASNALMSQVSSCLSMRPASSMWYTVVPV
jgi:hypothetical protein